MGKYKISIIRGWAGTIRLVLENARGALKGNTGMHLGITGSGLKGVGDLWQSRRQWIERNRIRRSINVSVVADIVIILGRWDSRAAGDDI